MYIMTKNQVRQKIVLTLALANLPQISMKFSLPSRARATTVAILADLYPDATQALAKTLSQRSCDGSNTTRRGFAGLMVQLALESPRSCRLLLSGTLPKRDSLQVSFSFEEPAAEAHLVGSFARFLINFPFLSHPLNR